MVLFESQEVASKMEEFKNCITENKDAVCKKKQEKLVCALRRDLFETWGQSIGRLGEEENSKNKKDAIECPKVEPSFWTKFFRKIGVD